MIVFFIGRQIAWGKNTGRQDASCTDDQIHDLNFYGTIRFRIT